MTLAALDEACAVGKGVQFHWMAKPDGTPTHNPERFRWYYIGGVLFECERPYGQAHWTIRELEPTRTGREWQDPALPPAR